MVEIDVIKLSICSSKLLLLILFGLSELDLLISKASFIVNLEGNLELHLFVLFRLHSQQERVLFENLAQTDSI